MTSPKALKFERCTHTDSEPGHCGMLIFNGKPAVHVVAYDETIAFYGRSPFTHPEKDCLDYVTRLSAKPRESQ